MPGEEPPPGGLPPGESSTPQFAQLGLRTPAGWVPFASEQPLPAPVIPDYTVLRRIGGGAYGAVWLARNLTGSHLAIKVVYRRLFDHDRPYERELAGIRRFEPISRSHASQVAIHHVGQNTAEGYFYYVMDLADDFSPELGAPGPDSPSAGIDAAKPAAAVTPPNPDGYVAKTLKHLLRKRGRLPSADCLEIALALATALEHLHGHGLIHRDIKPSNVIFIEGVPKLADIGLVTSMDATQSFVGTEGFFPPEGPGTPQADIFSLGKLLYEIATGKDRREFPELPTDVASAEEQEALSELNAIILKCCQHDPQQRYATAAALRAELERLQHGRSVKRHQLQQRRWLSVRQRVVPAVVGGLALVAIVAWLQHEYGLASVFLNGGRQAQSMANGIQPATPARLDPRAIFVLPMRPAGTNGAPEDLCSRITDAFIDSLGLLTNQGIRVGPRRSGWGHLEPVVQFARVTNSPFAMRYALTGRIGLAEDQYDLVLTLHDLAKGAPRWTETLRGSTNDLVGLEEAALQKIVASLGLEIPHDRLAPISHLLTNNLKALGWYRQAMAAYVAQGSIQPAWNEAIALVSKALQLDPRYVEASFHEMYMLRSEAQERIPAAAWETVKRRVDRILELDDTHAMTLDQQAGYALFIEGNWEAFEARCEECLAAMPDSLRPGYRAFYLRISGRLEEARAAQMQFEASEPTLPDFRFLMATARWVDRQWDDGIRIARRTLEMYPNNVDGYGALAMNLVAKGDYEQGIEVIRKARGLYQRQEYTALLGVAYARMGQLQDARDILQELLDQRTSRPYLQPYVVARVYAALGDKSAALDWLDKAADDRSEYLYFTDLGGLRTDPAWDNLKDEPRYWQLCDRLGLGKDQWPRPRSTSKPDQVPLHSDGKGPLD